VCLRSTGCGSVLRALDNVSLFLFFVVFILILIPIPIPFVLILTLGIDLLILVLPLCRPTPSCSGVPLRDIRQFEHLG